jgi:hypothetical protein
MAGVHLQYIGSMRTSPQINDGSSPALAATSGKAIYTATNGTAQTGTYWLKTPGGATYQAYIKMDQGGGWIGVNTALGGSNYSSITSATWGNGGGNMFTGASQTLGTLLNGSYVTNNQGDIYACVGANYRSQILMNTTAISDLGVTQVRWVVWVTSQSNVTCGYMNSNAASVTIINGTAAELGTCANPPNQYSQVTPASFTFEAYGNLPAAGVLFETWTACTGSYAVALRELYVR